MPLGIISFFRETWYNVKMKKYIKSFGFILLYLLIYFIIQTITGLVLAVMGSGISFVSEEFSEYLISYLNSNFSVILIISIFLSFALFSIIYSLRGKNIVTDCKLKGGNPGESVLYGGMFGFSANFVIIIILAKLMSFKFLEQTFEQYDSQVTSVIAQGSFLSTLVGVGIIGPIFEEIMFRGVISREFDELFSPKVVIVLQGLLFGVYHMNIIQGSYATLLGIFLAYTVYKTNSIWPSIAAHIVMNTTSLLFNLPLFETILHSFPLFILALVIVFFVLSIRHFTGLKSLDQYS